MPAPPAQPSCGRLRSRWVVSALRLFPLTIHRLLALRVAPAPSGTATRCSASRQKQPGERESWPVTKAAPPTARQLQERFDAQRAAARAQLAPVTRDDWWDKATPDMIERAHQTATAWKTFDPDAAQAAEKISEQVQARYGIDVNNTGADEASVSEALARAQHARLEADNERTKASAARTDEEVAAAAVAGANRQDSAAQQAKAEPAYDSPERRQQLADSLDGKETAKRSTPDSWPIGTKARRRRRL